MSKHQSPFLSAVLKRAEVLPYRVRSVLGSSAMALALPLFGAKALWRFFTRTSPMAKSTEAGWGDGIIALIGIVLLAVQVFLFLMLAPWMGLLAVPVILTLTALGGAAVGYIIPER